MGWLDNVSTDFADIISDIGSSITLQKPVYTFNDDRESVKTWQTVETGNAVVEMRNAQERDQDERLQGRLFHWVFYDTNEDVKPDWRFLVGSLVLNIEEPFPITQGVTVREFRCTQVLTGTT